ncbi:MAG TPA: DNA polymerase III subunit delta [Vicinamibacterales bacterium]|nr:DNA polymerase III subunit delta [Vicinamibacterales bacterium]
MTAAAVRKQLAAGRLASLYVLVGADEIEKTDLAGAFAETVDEGLRAFNVDRLHGAETSVDELIDCARTLPMMAPRRVVIVFEGEKLLIPRRETDAAEQEQQRLAAFLEAPPPETTIVFVCGPLDERRRMVKLLQRIGQIVDCGTITDEADAERWITARAARDGIAFEPAAVRALVERTGLDLGRLRAGFERLALYAMGQPTVTADDVRQAVPAAPETQAEFGIAKAIWRNDVRDALRELALALDAGMIPVLVMGQLRTAAERLPAPRLRAAIEAVFRTDLALKSSGGDARTLLERLVVELCGPGGPSRGAAGARPWGRPRS